MRNNTKRMAQGRMTAGIVAAALSRWVLAGSFLLLLGTPFTRHAMAQAASGDQLEEITVSAEKKSTSQRLQDTPIAITAVTSQTIADLHIADVTDIGRMAPNVELDGVGTFPGFANFTIRGIGVTTSVRSVDPAVNIFQDGMVIAYQAGAVLDTFDTESVQILRGPQGVLFGRNSAGGSVLLSTPLPTRDFHYSGDVTFGNFDEFDVHATVQGPLTNAVFGKVAVSEKSNSGYFENTTGGTFVPAPANPSGDPVEHATGNLPKTQEIIIKPTFLVDFDEGMQLKLFTQYQRYADGGGPSRAYIPSDGTLSNLQKEFGYYPPTTPYTTNLSDPGYTDITAGHLIAEFDWNIGNGTWTTIAAYRAVQYDATLEVDGTPFNLIVFPDNKESNNQESLESRYDGKLSDQIEYVAGTYLFTDISRVTEKRALNGFLIGESVTDSLDELNQWRQDDSTAALFGNVDYKVLPQLTLTTGIRYEYEYKKMHIIPLAPCSGENFTGCPNTYYDSQHHWEGLTPRFVASYNLAPDVMAYASYSKGFSAGNYNARAPTLATALVPTAPETVDAYEVGFKSQWFDRRLEANLAVYDNGFTNIQRTVDSTSGAQPVQTLLNAADATIQGVELETTALVYTGLRLNFSGGYTDGRFNRITGLPTGVVGTELQLDHVPKWTYDVGGKYDFNIPGLPGEIGLSSDYSWRSMVFTDLYNTRQLSQQSYGLLNASLNYANGPYQVRLFGRNLQNTDYVFIRSPSYGYQEYGGQPRTYGIELSAKF